ncbi:Zinc knuckle CX2CX4HX4C [Arabidopsis thaliana x Arabidopsis arenosa]|uniref:Protein DETOXIFICATION n=1 Tax=Arabidopsis thaliana x Arabidopsis arenosa TaxID=1240361 RepID=A0A8T2C4Z6_9BRAS|nr:Zinc knuckle CX2CX4HX4C [Arabidopsis thaliana x Arabidopsis arenosa]
MGSALETLCGQAYGAGQIRMMGIYMQRSWVILFTTALCLLPVYIWAPPILSFFGEAPHISKAAGKFALWMIPQLFAYAANFPIQKFLQSQRKVLVMAWISGVVLVIHAVFSWLFILYFKWGLVGAAITLNTSWWLIVIGQLLYILITKSDGAWTGFSMLAFRDLYGFVKLSLASALMLCLEFWYLMVLVVVTGLLPNPLIPVDAISICMNIEGWTAMISIGFNAAISVRVSNELGAGNAALAKFSVIVVSITSTLIGIVCMIVVLATKDSFPYFFTTSDAVAAETTRIAVLLGFTVLLNSLQPVLSGVAVGAGWQALVAYVNIACYYIIGLPAGLVLGFTLDFGVQGIWGGMVAGICLQTLILIGIIYFTNWNKEAEQAESRSTPVSSVVKLCRLEWRRCRTWFFGGCDVGFCKDLRFLQSLKGWLWLLWPDIVDSGSWRLRMRWSLEILPFWFLWGCGSTSSLAARSLGLSLLELSCFRVLLSLLLSFDELYCDLSGSIVCFSPSEFSVCRLEVCFAPCLYTQDLIEVSGPTEVARLASCPSGADVVLKACSRQVNSAVARNRTQTCGVFGSAVLLSAPVILAPPPLLSRLRFTVGSPSVSSLFRHSLSLFWCRFITSGFKFLRSPIPCYSSFHTSFYNLHPMSSSYRSKSGVSSKALPLVAEEDDPIFLPPVDNSHLLERFKLTLIGRTFNAEGRSTELLLAIMPKSHIWDVEGRVKGFDLGNGRFQFDFDNEGDLQRVLNKRPCHINKWSLALERWKPNARSDFPNCITFWVQTKGLPREFWSEGPLKSMGKSLGEVICVDEKTGKIQVSVDVTRPLRFEKKAISSNGEEHLVTFKYEKLHRYCFTCKMISHEERSCPHLTDEDRIRLRIERAELARKEAEEEELFRVPQVVTKNIPTSNSDKLLREDLRRDRTYSKEGRSVSRSEDRFNDQSFKDDHHSDVRKTDDIRRPARMARAETYKKDYHREQLVERRPSRHSPSFYSQEREHKPVWQRLEANHNYHYPRNRENFNSYHSDYRKRRHDESVATSSWVPKSARQQEGDYRNRKVQRLSSEDTRDARKTLDRKRFSEPHLREGFKEGSRKENSPRRDLFRQPSPRDSGKVGPPVEDGSRTITTSDLHWKRDNGRVYYKEKEKSRAGTVKASEKVAGLVDPLKAANTPKTKSRPISTGDLTPTLKDKVHSKEDLSKEDIAPLTEEEELQLKEWEEFEAKQNNTDLMETDEKSPGKEDNDEDKLIMQQEDLDNDDLLEDNLQEDDGQVSGSKASHRRRRTEAKSQTNKGATELPGMASKKRNLLNAGSPKKRVEAKSQTARSRNGKPSSAFPRSGVFPSAINRKSKSRSGHHEKQGGKKRSENSFLPFRTMIHNCGLIDFPFKGNSFSWVGRRRNGLIKCRLDRALGNEDWHTIFSHTNVEYLRLWGSDHRPILANILSKKKKLSRRFQFDKRWLGKEGLEEAIQSGWGAPSTDESDLVKKIQSCRRAISNWRKSDAANNNSAQLIEKLTKELDEAQLDENREPDDILQLKYKLCDAFREEEIFWKQKSRANWLDEGDENTKYFHASTKQRRAINRIIGLQDHNGTWIESEEGIEQIEVKYFNNLFTATAHDGEFQVLRDVPEIVTTDMNSFLTREVSLEEVKRAVFEMNPTKAPGPDGMTALFYQRFWPIISEDLLTTVRSFFTTGTLDPRLNMTNICLVPKAGMPKEMSGFRPISLCNVGYKIISKVLSNRLKRFLPKVISETQSAVVARRLITDNILIAQENFHALRSNSTCRKKFMAIKTDMSKAYDRVEWPFLRALLEKLGFSPLWVQMCMACIETVSYQVLINGEAKGSIVPSRGIRQGDPLSPYLFILCTEALIARIKQAEWTGRIQGLRLSLASPPVSHLLFADDSLFFCKADCQQSEEIISILRQYGEASGQQINFAKSSVMFGSKVQPQSKADIKTILGIHQEGGMGTYLGLPEKIHGSKAQVFAFVQDRLKSRINTWSAKFLSKGGKEILIKSVAQALPTYVMSCFLLPKNIRSKLSSAISNFWWSNKQESRGLHWIAWDKLCSPLSEGGLGFKMFEDFNLALLAKQLWRLVCFPDSLLARVLRGRYFKYSSPLSVKPSYLPSYGWRSMLAARPLLLSGLRKNIGSGFDTRVWSDPWIPSIPARPAKSRLANPDPNLFVSDLIDPGTKRWKVDKLQDLVSPEDVPAILGLHPSLTFSRDLFIWSHTKSGNYTVKTGYLAAQACRRGDCDLPFQGPSVTALQAQSWKIPTSRKIKHFIWQSASGCLATCQRLADRHLGTDRTCPKCGTFEETINHVLFECPPAFQAWSLSQIPIIPNVFPSRSLFTNLDYLFWRAKELGGREETLRNFPWIMWFIWKARNSKVFENTDIHPSDTVQHALKEAESFRVARARETILNPQPGPVLQDYHPNDSIICRRDGSWVEFCSLSGIGWIVESNGNMQHIGLRSFRRCLSPLHTEFESLLWAMRSLTTLSIFDVVFETDCLELTQVLDTPDEWPAFASELEDFSSLKSLFPSFTLSFIPRCNNTRADCLAKKARSRGSIFSHVSSSLPDWFSPEENRPFLA